MVGGRTYQVAKHCVPVYRYPPNQRDPVMRSLCAWRTECDAVKTPVRLSTSHDLQCADAAEGQCCVPALAACANIQMAHQMQMVESLPCMVQLTGFQLGTHWMLPSDVQANRLLLPVLRAWMSPFSTLTSRWCRGTARLMSH